MLSSSSVSSREQHPAELSGVPAPQITHTHPCCSCPPPSSPHPQPLPPRSRSLEKVAASYSHMFQDTPAPKTHHTTLTYVPAAATPATPPSSPLIPAAVTAAGTGAALGHAGIMSLLFGRHRSLPHTLDVFRDLPRLPLPLAPLRGDLAAGLNRGSRGLDIGQADPIWVSGSVLGWGEGVCVCWGGMCVG